MNPISFFPRSASTLAPKTDALFIALVVGSILIVILVLALLVIFSARYRRGSPAPRHGLTPVVQREFEVGWTTATLFAFLFVFWWAGATQVSSFQPPSGAMEIHVVAKQWMWKIQHPNGVREIDTLHVPVGEPARLVMTSQDVIHSFSVPDFRIKQDILPGRYVEAWFEATETGAFRLYCTQFCGVAHSAMTGSIVVMSKTDFAAWLAGQPATGDLAGQGRALFVSFFAFYWIMTGLHAIHLAVGVGLVARLAWLMRRSRLSLASPQLEIASLYWHLVDAFWLVLFPVLYIAGRG